MVYSAGQGLSYSELKAMDFYEYTEAVEARVMWQTEWNPKPTPPAPPRRFKRR